MFTCEWTVFLFSWYVLTLYLFDTQICRVPSAGTPAWIMEILRAMWNHHKTFSGIPHLPLQPVPVHSTDTLHKLSHRHKYLLREQNCAFEWKWTMILWLGWCLLCVIYVVFSDVSITSVFPSVFWDRAQEHQGCGNIRYCQPDCSKGRLSLQKHQTNHWIDVLLS